MTFQQQRVLQMIEGGTSFDRVEDVINSATGLDDDQRAALWLYAWSHRSRRAQRRDAAELLYAGQPAGQTPNERTHHLH